MQEPWGCHSAVVIKQLSSFVPSVPLGISAGHRRPPTPPQQLGVSAAGGQAPRCCSGVLLVTSCMRRHCHQQDWHGVVASVVWFLGAGGSGHSGVAGCVVVSQNEECFHLQPPVMASSAIGRLGGGVLLEQSCLRSHWHPRQGGRGRMAVGIGVQGGGGSDWPVSHMFSREACNFTAHW